MNCPYRKKDGSCRPFSLLFLRLSPLFLSYRIEIFTKHSMQQQVHRIVLVHGAVAVHIRHLREKIEINPSEPRYIKVVWGRGYKMEAIK